MASRAKPCFCVLFNVYVRTDMQERGSPTAIARRLVLPLRRSISLENAAAELALILVEVLQRLFLRRLLLEVVDLSALDGDIGCGKQRPQRFGQHLVAFQFVEGFVEGDGQATDAQAFALLVAIVAGIDLYGRAWIDALLDAVESCGDQGAHRQVWIAAVVGWLQLQVARRCFATTKERGDANGSLAIVESVDAICRAPVVGEQALIRVRTAAGEGDKRADVPQDASDEISAQLTQSSTLADGVEEILGWTLALFGSPQAQVDMRSTACLIQEWFGRKRSVETKRTRDPAYRLAHQADIIGGA